MAKFYGMIGFEVQKESSTGSGVWIVEANELPYCGDILQNTRRLEAGEQINDDININNRFSILADPYAYQYAYAMKYIVWNGIKWKIKSFDIQFPRIILTIGGVYNG